MLRNDIDLKNSKVLMVDDTPANIDVLRKVLINEGYQLFFANNGEKAIKIANRALPDLILLDVMMLGMTGFEVCRHLKQNEITKDIPVIFLTAKNQPEDVKEGFEIGAADYIYKPFRQEEVCARVRNHLQTCVLMRQMEEARIAANAANQAKSVFLANMSHELRTPLNGILGYTQIFQFDESLTDEQKQGIEVIHQSGQYLLTLINDILDLSRIETGQMELHTKDFHLKILLQNIIEIFKIQAEQKQLTFNYQQYKELPYAVHGDEKRLRQIIINLLSNAIKFTKQGSINVEVEYWNNKIRLRVADTGLGIAPEEINKIFQPFEQLGEVFYKPDGSGLGLSITKTFIEMMDGKLYATSIPEQGSIFSTILKLPPALLDKEPAIIGFTGQPCTILIFDNDIGKYLTDLLQPLGFNIIEATNEQDCMDKALQNIPNLIMMPVIPTAIDKIKDKLTETKIIAISILENNIETNSTDLIAKPFFDKELFAKLVKHLDLSWKYEQPEEQVGEDFVAPSIEQATEMFGFCVVGNIYDIKKYAKQLEQDETLRPFAEKVQKLAAEMQISKIRKLIEPYMIENSDDVE